MNFVRIIEKEYKFFKKLKENQEEKINFKNKIELKI